MAQDLLTKESPEIIRFFQDIEYLTRFLDSEQDRYRPVLNGERYITENLFPYYLEESNLFHIFAPSKK